MPQNYVFMTDSDSDLPYDIADARGIQVIRMPYANLKISLDNPVDSIKALDKMKLSGKVSGISSGSIALTLREGRIQKRLAMQNRLNDTINVKYDGPLIYSEVLPVKNGRFETEFVTPKKLNIGDSLAELRAWAYSSNDIAVGRYLDTNIVISGVSKYADSLNDKTPPVITIQSCNAGASSSFADGQLVHGNHILVVMVPDFLQVLRFAVGILRNRPAHLDVDLFIPKDADEVDLL